MFKVSLLLIVASLAVINALDPEFYEWNDYKARHGKRYGADEDKHRFEIYTTNKLLIEAHNKLADQGLYSFRLGPTKFADWTNEEYRQYNGFLGGQGRKASDINGVRRFHRPNRTLGALPTSVDWRTKGLVTAIKNQGSCGSCWAFSAVAGLEGQHAKATGKLVSLSEQNLVDCSKKEGNQGCNGGLMDYAFQYIKDVGGLDTEQSYPYEGKDDTCRFKKANVGATLKSWKDIKSGDESALQDATANVGPISVAIDASSLWFQLYFGGIYDHTDCKNDLQSLDHGVTVVGYGSEGGQDYWLIKNSWGTWWGESGYIRLARNKKNLCGVATAASYPLV